MLTPDQHQQREENEEAGLHMTGRPTQSSADTSVDEGSEYTSDENESEDDGDGDGAGDEDGYGERDGEGETATASDGSFAAMDPSDYDDDDDSAIGDDGLSSTISLSSSVLAFRTINGRTYHSARGNAQYWASNDKLQNESMNIFHQALLLAMDDRIYMAPLEDNIERAIDIGTGTGIWAVDFADIFPRCDVFGTDISPIQSSWVPPNVRFEIEDCTESWTYVPSSADFVHMRNLFGSIASWDALMSEAFRACRPGGWVESSELSPRMLSDDDSVSVKSHMHRWGSLFVEGGRRLGRTFEVLEDNVQVECMRRAGFVDIATRELKMPIGGWWQGATDDETSRMREVGEHVQAALELDYEGYLGLIATVVKGWQRKDIVHFCAGLRREIASGESRPYCNQRIVWGRKPE